MSHRLSLLLLIATLVLSACNLGSTPATTEEPIPSPDNGNTNTKPTISILSPQNGSEFVVDEEILVSVNAFDGIGVTRLQLLANNQIVKTVSSESLDGDTTMTAVLDYTPRAAGTVTLRAIAFRGSVSSDPAEIQVSVRSNQALVTATSILLTNVPNIPNDGVCRALMNVNLNFRQQPTTSLDNVITVLPSGALAPIIGRLGDNSWWKLNYNGQIGWVSSGFTTAYGNCQTVVVERPLATATPTLTPTATRTFTPQFTATSSSTPIPRLPDLVITSFVGLKNVVIPSGETEVTETYFITVTNTGLGAAGQFESILQIDDEEPIDLGIISSLGAGESFVLDVDITFEAADAGTTFDLTATADMNADDEENVDEVSEVNNRAEISVSVSTE